ncbi:MAG: hypothetical protein WC835_02500 [Candidatus Paceibacterota bacterium]|jgi:hypothetical protein
MKKTTLSFLLSALALFAGINPAHADGEVFFSGNNSFGASVFTAGNAGFFFGSQNGGPAVFSGSAFTATGFSQIWGQVGFQANAFVPYGTKGTAQAGGDFSYTFGARHQGGFPYTSYSTSVNNWSSSSGTGSASSNIFLNGNTSVQPATATTPSTSGGKG